MKNNNSTTYKSIYKILKGYGDRIIDRIDGRLLTFEDDNVKLFFVFSPSHTLTEVKAIWYANGYQCFKFTDLTENGVNKYFKLLNIDANRG